MKRTYGLHCLLKADGLLPFVVCCHLDDLLVDRDGQKFASSEPISRLKG